MWGSETTFKDNLSNNHELRIQIYEQNADAFHQLQQLVAYTIIKVKYADFTQITRSHTLSTAFNSADSAHWVGQTVFRHSS
ncbi:hypothetical protein [Psychrobacter sp. WY6]|uniref:DinB/UmuC family translesion DNA polymerase n=1 Tax=Psychrobacter sp. WY6 TaxID=2708350 RepID=UPI0032E7FD02